MINRSSSAGPQGTSPLPRHALVARSLVEQIGAERYRVGELLPTEAELCRQFGVSRTTLREAVRWLRAHGMVSARAGIGTRVLAREPSARYVHAINSLADVFQYAKDSRPPVVLASEEIEAGPADAELLRCEPGRRWLRIELTRSFRGDGTPILHALAWIPQAYQGIARLVPLRSTPIYQLLESEYHEPVVGVDQEFRATRLGARVGRLLGAARGGAPALCVVRHYFGRGERLLLVTQSHYRADGYSYRIGLRFDARGADAAARV